MRRHLLRHEFRHGLFAVSAEELKEMSLSARSMDDLMISESPI